MYSEEFVKATTMMQANSNEIAQIQGDIINVFKTFKSNSNNPEVCDSMALSICNCVKALLIGADTNLFSKKDVLVATKLKAFLLQNKGYDVSLVKEALDELVSRIFLEETPKKSR